MCLQRERWETRSSVLGFDRTMFSLALGMIGTDVYNSILNRTRHSAKKHLLLGRPIFHDIHRKRKDTLC